VYIHKFILTRINAFKTKGISKGALLLSTHFANYLLVIIDMRFDTHLVAINSKKSGEKQTE
jgi:hypothetical protein